MEECTCTFSRELHRIRWVRRGFPLEGGLGGLVRLGKLDEVGGLARLGKLDEVGELELGGLELDGSKSLGSKR